MMTEKEEEKVIRREEAEEAPAPVQEKQVTWV